MKTQLIMQDFGGRFSENPELHRSKLLKSGTWKNQRIVVVLPAGEMIPSLVALSYWNLMFPPNQPAVRILAQGMEVGHAYSTAVEQILQHPDLSKWEYMLTIEHDNTPPPDGVLRLIESMETHPEYSAIGGLYFTKGEDGVAQIWGDPKDPMINFRPQVPVTGRVQECCGTGMGFTLWRMSMFKDPNLPKPLFRTIASKEEGMGTQDLTFWRGARNLGYRCAIDNRVLVGHYDHTTGIIW